MSAEVKILIEGCSNADSVAESGEERTRSTITLVRDGDIKMIVDPGILQSQQILINALKKENLRVEDINVVCITHSHIDHYRNIGMFPNAKTLEYFGLWDKESIEMWQENFTPNIQILHTPGHDYTSITLFVTTKNGIVAICGDNFWKENYPQDVYDDVFASNPERLKESRRIILKMADWIIPGHGPMYKNQKKNAQNEEEFAKISSLFKTAEELNNITIKCKKCGREMIQKQKCQCQPHLCFKCCECDLDCDFCNCSHEKSRKSK